MSILLEKGERGLLCGMTGSGKTSLGFFLAQYGNVWPKIILDTKIEPAFDQIEFDKKKINTIDGLANFSKIEYKRLKDYTIVRPAVDEITDPMLIDEFVYQVYAKYCPCFLFIDEVYTVHSASGRAGPGLVAALTRGRSRGLTLLMGTQRPAWLSRFCFTEAQKFYIFRLNDARDRKTLGDVIPGYGKSENPEKHFFNYYQAGDSGYSLFKPAPLLYDPEFEPPNKNKWL